MASQSPQTKELLELCFLLPATKAMPAGFRSLVNPVPHHRMWEVSKTGQKDIDNIEV